jgi:group II intron reverse transcriptase/maturase
VQERIVQQLLLLVLEPEFEPTFSESSHGFRRGRGERNAQAAVKRYAKEGKTWVVDMDITKFFEHVNHDILMTKIGQKIRDKRILRLVGSYPRAGMVMPDGVEERSNEEGTPQGGPLSPLLANIYLDELDKELEKRGHAFSRYADDCNIYVSSEATAKRVLEGMTRWIKKKLRLEVNAKKSGTGRPWERKFLGMILTTALLLSISPQSLSRFEDRVRQMWDARQPLTTTELRDQWKQYVTGWWGYYQHAEDHRPVYRKEGWIRRQIRKCHWQRWHTTRGRQRALRRPGLPESRVRVASSSLGAWRMAANPVMHEAMSNRKLRKYGYLMPSDLAR